MRPTLSHLLRAGALPLALLIPALPVSAQNPSPTGRDLVALIAYYDQSDQRSLNAELARLQAKFPGWTPPSDIGRLRNRSPSSEIDLIFRQIAAGQLQAARASIATTKEQFPEWTPQADMIQLLETAEGQERLDAALMAGNSTEAIRVAATTPALLRCDRVNNAWRIAEVQGRTGDVPGAVRTYQAIIGACTNYPEIVATIEKADGIATFEDVSMLIDQAADRFEQQGKALAELKLRLALGRGLQVQGPDLPANGMKRPKARPGTMGAEPEPNRVTQVAAPAPTRAAPAPAAPRATRSASAPAPAPAPRSGGGGRVGGDLQSAAASGNWSRCVQLAANSTVPAVVAQRGWCAYNLNRPMEALAAFKSASGSLRGTDQRDARFGMALSYLKMNMTEEAAQIAASTSLTRQQRVETESIILDQRGVAAYQRREFARSIEYFNAIEKISGGLRRDLAMLRAYAYLHVGAKDQAKQKFQILNDQLSTRETRKALNDLD